MSCPLSTPLYTDFLCLLADPLGFYDPPLSISVAERTRHYIDINAAMARCLHCVCSPHRHLPSSLLMPVPSFVLGTPPLPWTVWMSCTLLSHLSLWVLPLSFAFLVAVLRCLPCLVLRTLSAMTRSPFLVCMLIDLGGLLQMLWPPRPQTVPTKFPFRGLHTTLLWFRVTVMLDFRVHDSSTALVCPRLALQAGGRCPLGYG
jgi:hypothetical protein